MTILSAIGKTLFTFQLCLGCHMVLARTDDFQPAEPPPLDFSTNYYVDSRGCGFVRANLDGVTCWAPLFTKDRQPVCNVTEEYLDAVAQSAKPVLDTASAKMPLRGVPVPASPVIAEKNARSSAKLGANLGVQSYPAKGSENMPPDYATAWQTQTATITVLPNNEPCGLGTLSAWSSLRLRFVQVGTFSVRANVDRTVARLKTMGMPTVIKQNKINGKVYCAVLSGPFDQKTALTAALKTARKAGFKDAFARR